MDSELPVLIMAFIRPDLLRKSLEQLAKASPPILYVVGDGPRNEKEEILCSKSREIAMKPGWDCEVIPLFSDENKGLVPSFLCGMNRMFKDHEYGIFLEDDILLSPSFYPFAKELLVKYRDNPEIGHINASNFLPKFSWKDSQDSYLFSNQPHIWGFATWRRMWNSYDVNMPAWKTADQKKLLDEHCFYKREKSSLKHLFDLHCENPDPWACDYQWIFNCWYNKALSITPKKNMSLNIGFDRTDSTHTTGGNPLATPIHSCDFPLNHPSKVSRNIAYDRALSNRICPSELSKLIGKFKNKIIKLISGKF